MRLDSEFLSGVSVLRRALLRTAFLVGLAIPSESIASFDCGSEAPDSCRTVRIVPGESVVFVDQSFGNAVVAVARGSQETVRYDNPLGRDGPEVIMLPDPLATYSVTVFTDSKASARSVSIRAVPIATFDEDERVGFQFLADCASEFLVATELPAHVRKSVYVTLIRKYEQAARHFRRADNEYFYGLSQFAAAELLYEAGKWEKAQKKASSLASELEAHGHPLLARVLHLQAQAAAELASVNSVRNALDTIDRSIDLHSSNAEEYADEPRKAAERYNLAVAINTKGFLLYQAGSVRESLPYFEEAARLLIAAENPVEASKSLNNQGKVLESLGRFGDAIASYKEAISFLHGKQSPLLVAEYSENLGDVLAKSDSVSEAIDNYLGALDLFRKVSDIAGEMRTLDGLGKAYFRVGNWDLAADHLESAAQLAADTAEARPKVETYLNLGAVYLRQRNLERAVGAYVKALELTDRGTERTRAFLELSRIHWLRGDLKQARRVLQLAKKQFAGSEDVLLRAEILELEAQVVEERGLARNKLLAALKIHEQLNSASGTARVKLTLARLERSLGNTEGAIQLAVEASAAVEKVRDNVGHSPLQYSLSGQYWPTYDFLISQLLSMTRNAASKVVVERETAFAVEALAVAERSRARALSRMIARADYREGTAPDRLIDSTPRGSTYRGAEQIAQLHSTLHRVQPDSVEVAHGEVITRVGQEMASQPDAALLYFHVGESESVVWLFRGQRLSVSFLPPRGEIDALVDRMRGTLVNPRLSRYVTQAQLDLSTLLLSPLGGEFPKELIVVVDGSLHSVPFGALRYPGTDIYVAQRTRVRRVPSLHFAHYWLTAETHQIRNAALIVADPEHENASVRRAETASPKLGGVVRRLSPLPHSRDEALELAKLFGKSKILDGASASRYNFLRENLDDYGYVVFSTHALIDEKYPEKSSIVLSMGDQSSGAPAEYLTAGDILNLSIPGAIVVLSNCSSGLGKSVRGEGLLGLQSAFFAAGARAVVSTLWPIVDRSNADVIAAMLRDTLPIDEAVRPSAKSEDTTLEDPYIWAAFTYSGM